jgi:hypothetical protein
MWKLKCLYPLEWEEYTPSYVYPTSAPSSGWNIPTPWYPMDLAQIFLTGMTLMEQLMIASGARLMIDALAVEVNMQTKGTRQIVHAVLVVVAVVVPPP